MKYINYLVNGKYARGSEGHLDASDLVDKIKNHDGSEAYYNHFDVREDALKVEIDTGKTQLITKQNKKTGESYEVEEKVYRYVNSLSEVKLEDGELLVGRTFKGAEGLCRPAFGLVGFDFDDEESPENSLRDVQAFLNYFRFEYFYVAYSGSKGFHISIPFEYFGLPADENLPKTLRNLAHELKPHFKTLDTSVYNIGRKFRAPNTKHGKTGLYKTIISHVGVDTKDIEAIKEYCKTRRDTIYEVKNYEVTPNQTLVEIIARAKTTASYDKSKAGTAMAPTRLEEYDGKICIKRLFEAEIDEGERNTTALILVNDLFKSGKAKEHCINVMTPWITRVMPEHRRAEVFQIIDDIYSGNRFYNHGCLEPIKSKHCSAKCGLWAKLSPTKRPTPVDAPKSAFKEEQKSKKLPATDYIYSWFDNHNIDVTLANLWFKDGISTSVDVIAESIFHDYHAGTAGAGSYKQVTKQLVNACITVFYDNTRKIKMKEMQDYFAYTGDNDLVEQYLEALLDDVTTLDIEVMKHWLWLVKRNIFGLNTAHHIMPIFTGKSGAGKSRAISSLVAVLEDTVDEGDLSMLSDDRNDFRLMESFVMVFDEMAKVNKLDIDMLKKKITAEYLTYRVLGTNHKKKGRKTCTFIGTSNYAVIDMIKDPTSVRRYYEFRVKDKADWSKVNELDYMTLWRGVNEHKEEYYVNDFYELSKVQENFRQKDEIEEWLDECGLYPENDSDIIQVPAQVVYDEYVAWLAKQRRDRFAFSMTRFGREMKKYVDYGRNKSHIFYKISKNFNESLDTFDPSR